MNINYVFIVGSPRSGTTYLQTELYNRVQSVTGQETNLFDIYLRPFFCQWNADLDPEISGRGVLGLPAYISEYSRNQIIKNTVNSIVTCFIDALVEQGVQIPSEVIFIEKTPSHALEINSIRKVFPNARFIHIYRDPVSTVLSIRHASKSWGKHWAPSSIIGAYRMWKSHVISARLSLSQVPNESWTEVNYDNLLLSPENEATRIMKALNLPPRLNSDGLRAIPIINNRRLSFHVDSSQFNRLTYKARKSALRRLNPERILVKLLYQIDILRGAPVAGNGFV